jgi:hypothetical protein
MSATLAPPVAGVVVPTPILQPFLDSAHAEYCLGLRTAGEPRQHFPRIFALLVGRLRDDRLEVVRLASCRNAREDDGLARQEFEQVVAARYGVMYKNTGRGYWCDSRTLFAVWQEAEADGLELLGSIHLHPDWHRIGPPDERHLRLSEQPTPTDEHLFRRASWPLNIICFVERRHERFSATLAAWAPPPPDPDAGGCAPLPLVLSGPAPVRCRVRV